MSVRPVQKADIPAVAKMLSRAFADDPFLNWFLRKDAGRDAGSDIFFTIALELALPHGQAVVTDDLGGAALWFPPGTWKMGLWQQLKLVPRMASAIGWKRLPWVVRHLDKVISKHPREPHRYLYILGVDPVHQGRGVGGTLMGPAMAECDRARLPSYLETSKERNLGFYQRQGYRVRDEVVLPPDVKIWTMWREAPK